ncbi:MAG: site-2 protease family protein [Promethearchaeota archaeon]
MKIAKIKGIEIRIHLSTLLIVVLIGFYAASFYISIVPTSSFLELFLVGLISGVIILISILIHELSHSILAQRKGLIVSEIDLYFFGGVSKIEEEPKSPKAELLIAAVGPLSSLLIGIIFLVLYYSPISMPTIITVILFYSGITNIGLGFFNLLPAFPIDGGRLLRAFLWKRRDDYISATKSASRIGVGFSYGLMAYGIFQMLSFGLVSGIWLILMGFFLRSSAKQSYFQTLNEYTLSNISVKEMLNIPKKDLEIPFNMTVSDAVREYFIPYKKSYFPVIQGDKVVGVVHVSDVKKVSLNERPRHIVGYIMRNISEIPDIEQNRTGKDVMKQLRQSNNPPKILIVREKDNNEIIGFIGEDELVSSLKYWNLNIQNV